MDGLPGPVAAERDTAARRQERSSRVRRPICADFSRIREPRVGPLSSGVREIHRTGSESEAGYLCDLLSQHGIEARAEAGAILLADAEDELQARRIVRDALEGSKEEGRVSTPVRWLRRGRRFTGALVLLLLAFAVTSLAVGKADPLTLGVVFLLFLFVLWVGWNGRRRQTDPL